MLSAMDGAQLSRLVWALLSQSKDQPAEAYQQLEPHVLRVAGLGERERVAAAWIIYRYIKQGLQRSLDSLTLRRALGRYLGLGVPYPSLAHSCILRMAVAISKQHADFKLWRFFVLWGGVAGFQPEDWEPGQREVEEGARGGRGPSEFPSAVARLARQLVRRLESEERAEPEALATALALCEALMARRQADRELMRACAILHAKNGDRDTALGLYERLVRRGGGQWYVWAELGAMLDAEPMAQLGMMARAMRMQREEKFLVKIYLRVAELLLRQGMRAEARYALVRHRTVSEANGWHLRARYSALWQAVSAAPDIGGKAWQRVLQGLQPHAEAYLEANALRIDLVLVKRWEKGGKAYAGLTDGGAGWYSWAMRPNDPMAEAPLGSLWRGSVELKGEADGQGALPEAVDVASLLAERKARISKFCQLQAPRWSLLPLRVGFIGVINPQKAFALIFVPDGENIYLPLIDQSVALQRDDYVRFRTYLSRGRGGREYHEILELEVVDGQEAVLAFPTLEATVMAVQPEKRMFRIKAAPEALSGLMAHCASGVSMPPAGAVLTIWYHHNRPPKGKPHLRVLRWARC